MKPPVEHIRRARALVLLAAFLLTACNQAKIAVTPTVSEDSPSAIEGTWAARSDGSILTFRANGRMEVRDSLGRNPFSDVEPSAAPHWEAVTEVYPHQLYMVVQANGELTRVPVFIYKIEEDALVTREIITYERTYSGISFGQASRYEFPPDFNGFVEVFDRLK